jgi:D-alanine-D-alanine ligase
MKRHVAVLMGGLSAEREISLRSGEACATALEERGYLVSRVDVGHDVASALAQLKPDVVFNALHGKYGEDGCVQGLLELLHIPYTHSGVLASSVAMNKEVAKSLMAAAGVPTPQGRVVHRLEAAKGHVLPPPYVLKPVSEGSSFGVFIIEENAQRPPPADQVQKNHDRSVPIEAEGPGGGSGWHGAFLMSLPRRYGFDSDLACYVFHSMIAAGPKEPDA